MDSEQYYAWQESFEPKATELAILMKTYGKQSDEYHVLKWELWQMFVDDCFVPQNQNASNIEYIDDSEEVDEEEIYKKQALEDIQYEYLINSDSEIEYSELDNKTDLLDKSNSILPTISGSMLFHQAWNVMEELTARFSCPKDVCEMAVFNFAQKYILGEGVKNSCIDLFNPEKGCFRNYLRNAATKQFKNYFTKLMDETEILESIDESINIDTTTTPGDIAAKENYDEEIIFPVLSEKRSKISEIYKSYFDSVNSIYEDSKGNYLEEKKLLVYHVWFATNQFNVKKTEKTELSEALKTLTQLKHTENKTQPTKKSISNIKKLFETGDERTVYYLKDRLHTIKERFEYLWNKSLIYVCNYQNRDYQFTLVSEIDFLSILFARLEKNNIEQQQFLDNLKDWENKAKTSSGWTATVIRQIVKHGFAKKLNEELKKLNIIIEE